MKKTLAIALATAGLTVGLGLQAYAADWVPPKVPDPIPDNLTFWGITPIGALDLGYAYQTNGRPLGSIVSGLEFSPFTTTRNYTGQSISTIAHSGLQQSFLGVKIEEPLGAGWAAIARADTGVDPLQGKLSDGCSSFIQNAGVNYNSQTSNADSGRCGQAFNGQLWGGITNKQYGTLTIGRQNSFELDNIGKYDPMELSYAFSLLGYSGTNGGMGSTQAARWDNSAKYVYDFGMGHVGAMYSNGGSATGIFGSSYSFTAGANYKGFAIDTVYTKEKGAVNLQTSVNDLLNQTTLAANISDNTAWSVMARYTWNLGSSGGSRSPYPTKAVKAEPENDKFIVFAGYTHIRQSDPSTPILLGQAAGGYPITVSAAAPVSPDNDAFTTPKVLDFYWVGAKYEFAWGLQLTGAYYHVNQNSYVADGVACTAGGASRNQCAGTYDQGSLLADYFLNKHLDVYTGITYAQVNNGLASSFPGTPNAKFGQAGTGTSINTATWMSGFRIRL